MRIGICPGSFDPVTNGHIDVFERASTMFDELIVAVFHNPSKKPLFNMAERVYLLEESTKHLKNVRIDSFSGLLNVYVKQQNSKIIVRGLRALIDFEYEFQRALLIKKVDPDIETVFMMTSSEYSFLSSSGVKELAQFGGCIKGLVPECVEIEMKKRYQTS
ncbi:MAG: pantetheine-phosphate adenylyltransferase [Veillonellaceae bacterium]|nr:pantetheine-phosphate adenylyltransferase [Veillonellaceae bacterium]